MSEVLQTRQNERETLLTQIEDLLKSDLRVVAAWLRGSLGRGSEDEFSDIDIYVMVSEKYLPFIANASEEFVSRVPGLVLSLTEDANAPHDGAYLLTMYHGNTGPHQVDWYWITDRAKEIPAVSRLLFNNTNIPITGMDEDSQELDLDVNRERSAFWVLATISAKKIARGELWAAISLLGQMQSILYKVSEYGSYDGAVVEHIEAEVLPPVSCADQLNMLRKMIIEMKILESRLRNKEANLAPDMATEIAPLLALAANMISNQA